MKAPENGLCIVFIYHKSDELTLSHFEALRRSNPRATIVPVVDSVPGAIPGTIDVGRFPSRWDTSNKWRSCDTIFYRWFENRSFDAEKYVPIEYDCLCTVDLREHFRDVWDAQVAPVNYFTWPKDAGWHWFGERDRLPPGQRDSAAGIMPFTCCLFSHEALEKVVAAVSGADLFSELRMGTAVRSLGLEVRRMPRSVRKHIFWHVYPWKVRRPGLYHGIKSLDHNERVNLKSLYKSCRLMFPTLDRLLQRLGRLLGR